MVTAKATRCWLSCLANLHPPILLPHNQPCVIGRSRETKIRDTRCSKSQVELLADYTSYIVTARQLGANSSSVNGQKVLYGSSAQLQHGDIIEVLAGGYEHRVDFDPPPTSTNTVNSTTEPEQDTAMPRGQKKRTIDDHFSNPKKAKQEGPVSGGWEKSIDGDLLVYQKNMTGSEKIAGYDMDGTLIATQSGKVFATSYDDWKILYSEIPGKLKKLHESGYKIIIFTNQAGIGTGKHTAEGIQKKIESIIQKLGVPIQVFISTGKGEYRKPAIGMWNFFLNEANGGVEVDLDKSIFVGDAAGRPAEGKKKKDFSFSDRLFALNVGLKFYTPEEHFLDAKTQAFNMPEFDPRKVDASLPLYDPSMTKVPGHKLEMIVLVGFPGSGKSFFCSTHLAPLGYVVANRDTIGSWQKCVSVMEQSLKDGKHVVIDNTNPDLESRKRYIEAAKKCGATVRCFIFATSKDHARHNNKFREFSEEDHSKVSDMVFNMYKSKYVEPTLKEGFHDIVKVNFIPHFKNQSDEKMYKMFLLEK
ncbi:LOW QUALITY PROTEIN: uncharacterized protein F21D5.5-like [Portunus trituberculatus]|uniref:LOW QUALITY PROTEIN: uncharacterized protein F21D5.5-like n=1 Tax=Portunus trituberculatus TaxID=210409 RepID=UPI001E1CDC01|nr:LOW QUALITY PROTEIN: uncharacterized protein F21D5.5-like [Portunus trituberculatus]